MTEPECGSIEVCPLMEQLSCLRYSIIVKELTALLKMLSGGTQGESRQLHLLPWVALRVNGGLMQARLKRDSELYGLSVQAGSPISRTAFRSKRSLPVYQSGERKSILFLLIVS